MSALYYRYAKGGPQRRVVVSEDLVAVRTHDGRPAVVSGAPADFWSNAAKVELSGAEALHETAAAGVQVLRVADTRLGRYQAVSAEALTTDPPGPNGNTAGDYYPAFTETSASAALASGVAALILSANPLLKWCETKRLIAETCIPRTKNGRGRYRDDCCGYGRINAFEAVKRANGEK